MPLSRCLLLVPLGLLIVLPGCSGSRMRQIFAPDREFMALSELREYEARKAADPDSSLGPRGLLASLSRDNSDESTDEDGEKPQLLSLSRWLPARDDDSVPTDPFVGLEQEVSEETPADSVPVATAGLTEELPDEDTSDFVANAFDADLPAADLPAAEIPEEMPENQEDLPTFADIMKEFEGEEGFEDSTDEMDELAEAWLARQSESAPVDDEEPVEDPGMTDFEALLAEATAEVTPTEESTDDDVPSLNFDMLSEQSSETAEQLVALNEPPADPESIERLIEEAVVDSPVTVDQLVEDDPMAHDSISLPASPSEAGHESTADRPDARELEIVRQDQPADTQQSATRRQFSNNLMDSDDIMGDWDFGPPQSSADVTMEFPPLPSRPDDIESARTEFQRPAFHHPATGLPGSPQVADAGSAATTPARSNVFDDTRFLNDFEQQATVSTAAPEPAGPEPATAAGGSFISRQSPRTWLLLVGAVVIGYLLVVPERQNLRQTNNR